MEDLTRPSTHILRLLRWGRTLARHGALRGIEGDPNTPPQVRRLTRIARFGTFQPRNPDYAPIEGQPDQDPGQPAVERARAHHLRPNRPSGRHTSTMAIST